MTSLRTESLLINGVELGPPNPLPGLLPIAPPAAIAEMDDSVPAEARRYIGYGGERTILPYQLRDGYTRARRPRPFKVAILENEFLRATFLLDFGGRIWSLYHKPSSRELLYRNPVFQPGNLAVLNAWFSGGVEWNAGVPGHSPLTCAPLFAARVTGSDGAPVLRLYEWERIRGVPYQMDFILPAGSPWLFVQVRLSNPQAETLPMYWWSNIAVPERRDVRVLAPAEAAINSSNFRKLAKVPIPRDLPDRDATYAANLPQAADYFFLIPDGRQPWVTALDAGGRGLLQTSTPQMRGRKLFIWGMNAGGRRWQEFLSEPGQPYLEIQAGIARTQYECFPMAPGSELCWLEAYGLLSADPAAVHGADWTKARQAVESVLASQMPASRLETLLAEHQPLLDRPPDEILHRGSGWGALELRRQAMSDAAKPPAKPPEKMATTERGPSDCSQEACSVQWRDALCRVRGGRADGSALSRWPGLDFGSPGPDQERWRCLLEEGYLPEGEPGDPPGPWMVQKEWRTLLERSLAAPRGSHWLSWLHAGVMRWHEGDGAGAVAAWETSLRLRPSAWALRNLALHALHAKQYDKAMERYRAAQRQLPGLLPLAIECLTEMLDHGGARPALEILRELVPAIRAHGRVRVLEARALVETGDLTGAEAILTGDIEIPDIREGANVLSDLWFSLKERQVSAREGAPVTPELSARVRREFPPPAQIDFRMTAGN